VLSATLSLLDHELVSAWDVVSEEELVVEPKLDVA